MFWNEFTIGLFKYTSLSPMIRGVFRFTKWSTRCGMLSNSRSRDFTCAVNRHHHTIPTLVITRPPWSSLTPPWSSLIHPGHHSPTLTQVVITHPPPPWSSSLTHSHLDHHPTQSSPLPSPACQLAVGVEAFPLPFLSTRIVLVVSHSHEPKSPHPVPTWPPPLHD